MWSPTYFTPLIVLVIRTGTTFFASAYNVGRMALSVRSFGDLAQRRHGSECVYHQRELRIPFATADHATIAKRAIEVDAELQPHAAKRVLGVEDNVLVALVLVCWQHAGFPSHRCTDRSKPRRFGWRGLL